MWFVYLLECADGSLYCGVTPDLHQRIGKHNAGKGAKYTAVRRPVQLRYWESLENRSLAQKREYELKQLSRSQKLGLIEASKLDLSDVS